MTGCSSLATIDTASISPNTIVKDRPESWLSEAQSGSLHHGRTNFYRRAGRRLLELRVRTGGRPDTHHSAADPG